uniref:COP9 signalosome complex subunit 3 N-terminal helical repeats domain-containing protein n=1 Tax=Trypanosoma congolense (strain IL3000) TaxID=1068625 RepID=G0UWR2_TRYCI|nr:conserved hypothetical protein [Trypanosoma congolense IL3000]
MNTFGILQEVAVDAADDNHYLRLETLLEQRMSELTTQPSIAVNALKSLMDMENSKPRRSYALGMTYLAAAVVLGCGPNELDDVTSSTLVQLVERHLLSPESAAYSQLRGHRQALQRFEQVLKGYTVLLDIIDVGNYARKLYYLKSAVENFSPSPVHLTVAHPLLVREAMRWSCPAPAIAMMQNQVLEISSKETGAGIACSCSYYYEGGMMLAFLQCWEAAVSWLRSAMTIAKSTTRARNTAGKVAQEATGLLHGEKGLDYLLVETTKMFILASIAYHGELGDGADRANIQQIAQQYRSSNLEPYMRLLNAAMHRNREQWIATTKHFASLWDNDGTTPFVAAADERLQRHIVVDMAKFTSCIRRSSLLSAINSHMPCSVEEATGNTAGGQGSICKISGEVHLTDLLLAMREEGDLTVSIENVSCPEEAAHVGVEGKEEECGISERQFVVVKLAPPPRQVPRLLGDSQKGNSYLCLCDEEVHHMTSAQIQQALHEGMQLCERAHTVLKHAREVSRGEAVRESEVS